MEPSSQFSVECLQLFMLLGVRGTKAYQSGKLGTLLIHPIGSAHPK